MEENTKKHPILSCVILFSICGLARLTEYFVIKTDRTVLSENFLHKVFGILVLAVILYLLHTGWHNIGFVKNEMAAGIVKGLGLGAGCFIMAYSLECLILYRMNRNVSLSFYISGFSLSGETATHESILFLILCVVFNIINVWMEEGVFRGLFMKILSEKLSFFCAVLFIALLFGIWHWVMPLRDFMEGSISLSNLLIMSIGYIILAGIMSIKWSLLYKLTGTLWMGLGDHLFNNIVVTNLLHVVSDNQADSLQILRILTGQMLSFSIVMLYYKKTIKLIK